MAVDKQVPATYIYMWFMAFKSPPMIAFNGCAIQGQHSGGIGTVHALVNDTPFYIAVSR